MSKQQSNLELRHLAKVEIREAGSGTVTISGYAVVYGRESQELGSFTEVVAPGCFTKCLSASPDIRLLVEHGLGGNLPLARTRSGTLKLSDGTEGLHFEASLDLSDPDVARIIPKMRRGDVSGMSFGFFTDEDSWHESNGKVIRTVHRARIVEVSIVGDPAYTDTSVALRSRDAAMAAKAPKENFDVLRARLDLLSL